MGYWYWNQCYNRWDWVWGYSYNTFPPYTPYTSPYISDQDVERIASKVVEKLKEEKK